MDQELRSNLEVAKLCRRVLHAGPAEPRSSFIAAMECLPFWWQTRPPQAPPLKVGQEPDIELNDLVFFAYCYAAFRLAPQTPPAEYSLSDCPWAQKPVFEPRPVLLLAALYQQLRANPTQIRAWAHRRRWHERVTRPLLTQVRAPETEFRDPLVSTFRTQLEKELLQSEYTDAFFTQGRVWIQGSLLPLGARADFVRDNPLDANTTPMAKLFDTFVSAEEKQAIYPLINSHPLESWAQLPPEMQELWMLLHYCYSFDQFTTGATRFQFMYVILWHQWDQPESETLLQTRTRLHRPALPLLCALGGAGFGVLSDGTTWRVCDTLIHALVVWIQQVVLHHQGKSENGIPIWTCGIQIPLPLREDEL